MTKRKKIKNDVKNYVIDWIKSLPKYFLIAFVLLILIAVIPSTYSFLFGNKIIENHIDELNLINKTSIETAETLLFWLEENVQSPYEYKPKYRLLTGGIYNLDGDWKVFFKTTNLAWIIKSQLGNCGEKSTYFFQMMERLGHNASEIHIKAEDHAIASFYTENGTRIYVEPSENQIIWNLSNYTRGRYWSYIEEFNSGNTFDITSEFLDKTYHINITSDSPNIQIALNSIFLKNRSERYNNPFNVIKYHFKENLTKTIELGRLDYYELISVKSYGLFYFKNKEEIDFTNNQNIIVSKEDIIKLSNFRMKPIIMILIVLLIVFSTITWRNHKKWI